jgi:hypothetical protein
VRVAPDRPRPYPARDATCGTIRTKLLKIGAQVRFSVRRVKVAMATACPYANEFALVYARMRAAAA